MKTLLKFVSLVVLGLQLSFAGTALAVHLQSSTLTWNRIALEAIERAKPTQHQAIRLLTYTSLAQYTALNQAQRGRPARDAVATASMLVIAELIPSQAAFVQERLQQMQHQVSPLGQQVAQRVLAAARSDGFDATWSGQVPQAAYAWRSLANPPVPPAYPIISAMRTFFIASGSSFRPMLPPALGSSQFVTDLAEVRAYAQSPSEESTRLAKFYDMTTGTLAGGFWNEVATRLIRSNHVSELQTAATFATMNAAMMDGLIACHDAKYAYWVPRPSQADPSIKPLIRTPNHPSYPSNHSCLSTAAALTLSYFFPHERVKLEGTAAEAGLSRIYAGIHYRFDVTTGEAIGRNIAAVTITRHPEVLAQWASMYISQAQQ